jgi:hypothetical protein
LGRTSEINDCSAEDEDEDEDGDGCMADRLWNGGRRQETNVVLGSTVYRLHPVSDYMMYAGFGKEDEDEQIPPSRDDSTLSFSREREREREGVERVP